MEHKNLKIFIDYKYNWDAAFDKWYTCYVKWCTNYGDVARKRKKLKKVFKKNMVNISDMRRDIEQMEDPVWLSDLE